MNTYYVYYKENWYIIKGRSWVSATNKFARENKCRISDFEIYQVKENTYERYEH